MKHIIKTHSIYEFYRKYNAEMINVILKYLKKERITTSLLQKFFGINYDGKNISGNILAYYETEHLDNVLTRIDELLMFANILITKENKTLKDIENILKSKDDLALSKYVMNVIKGTQNQESLTVKDFCQKYNLKYSDLTEIVEYHENTDEKIAFKYKYGLGLAKLEEKQISLILNVDEPTVKKYIDKVTNNLPKLYELYQKNKALLTSYFSKPKAILKKVSLKEEPSRPKVEAENAPSKPKVKIESSPLKNSSSNHPKKLYEYLFDRELSESEIKEYQAKFDLIASLRKTSSSKTYEYLDIVCHSKLDQTIDFSKVNSSQKRLLYAEFKIIKNYIDLDIEEIKTKLSKPRHNTTNHPKKLYEYLFDRELSESEIKEYQTKFDLIANLRKTLAPKSYDLIKEVCQNKLNQAIDFSKLNANQKSLLYREFEIVTKYIDLDIEEIKVTISKPRHNNNFKKLYEYLFDRELNESEIEEYQVKFDLIANLRKTSSSKTYEYLNKACHFKLDQKVDLTSLTKNQKRLLYIEFRVIKKYINLDIEELKKLHSALIDKNYKPKKLYEYLFDRELTESEIKEYQAKFDLIVSLRKTLAPKSYDLIKEVCQNKLNQATDFSKLNANQKSLIYTEFRVIKKYINLDIEKIKTKLSKPRHNTTNNPKKLYEYLFDRELSESEIKEYQAKFDLIVSLRKTSSSKTYEYLNKVCHNKIDQKVDLTSLTKNQKVPLYPEFRLIKKYIGLDMEEIETKLSKSRHNTTNNPKKLYEYLFDRELSESEIKEYQAKFDLIVSLRKTSSSKTYEYLNKVCHNKIDQKVDLTSLTKNQKSILYTEFRVIKKYINLDIEKIKTKLSKLRYNTTNNPKKLYEYLFDRELTESEIKEYQAKFDLIANLRKKIAPKSYNLLKEVCQSKLNQAIDFSKLNASQKSLLYTEFRVIKKYINLDIEKIKTKLSKPRHNTTNNPKKLYEYLFDRELSESEIKEYQVKFDLIASLRKTLAPKSYDLIKKVCHNKIGQKIDFSKLNANQKNLLYREFEIIKKYINLDIEEIKTKLSKSRHNTTNNPKKLYEYLFDRKLSESEIEEYQVKFDLIVRLRKKSASKTYEYLNKACHFKLDKKVDLTSLTRSQKALLYTEFRVIKKYIDLDVEKIQEVLIKLARSTINNHKKLYEYLFDRELSESEIKEYQVKFDLIASLRKTLAPKSYDLLKEVCHNKIDQEIDLTNLTKKQKGLLYNAIKDLKQYITVSTEKINNFYIPKNLLDRYLLNQNLNPDELVQLRNSLKDAVTHNKYVYNLFIDTIKVDIRNNYELLKDDLEINRLINAGKTPEEISAIKNISLNAVIMSLINNINQYNVMNIVNYIINDYPEYIEILLASSYFKPYLSELSFVEQRVIYLKLLAKTNANITDEYIANLFNIELSEIQDYQIMSKHDEINMLNLCLKK